MTKPLVIAHRGDSSLALENSLDAIIHALSVNVDMIEVDVRRSRDNGLYIMHDRMTGRTADRNCDIERSMAGMIDLIRLSNGERIPTLADLLALVRGKCSLNLEVKSAGAGILIARHLRSSGYQGRVLVSSFKEEEVLAVHSESPELPVSMIFDAFTARRAAAYRKQGYTFISLRKKTATEKLINALHEQGIQVYVWTVDEEAEMRMLLQWGVDGIYSNKPAVLRRVVDAGFGVTRG